MEITFKKGSFMKKSIKKYSLIHRKMEEWLYRGVNTQRLYRTLHHKIGEVPLRLKLLFHSFRSAPDQTYYI